MDGKFVTRKLWQISKNVISKPIVIAEMKTGLASMFWDQSRLFQFVCHPSHSSDLKVLPISCFPTWTKLEITTHCLSVVLQGAPIRRSVMLTSLLVDVYIFLLIAFRVRVSDTLGVGRLTTRIRFLHGIDKWLGIM